MKKAPVIAVLSILALGLVVTAAEAQVAGCTTPGGANSMWGAMTNHSDALRVRNHAYAREIIKQPDSTLGLTCFDRALALTSRLGLIFSDAYLPNLPPGPANAAVFGASAYSAYATDGWLIADLRNVISAGLQDHASDFADSPAKDLGATALKYLDTLALSSDIAAMTTLTASQSMASAGDACSRIAAAWGNTTPLFAKAIEGGGPEDGAPYFSYSELLSGTPAGAGPDLLADLATATNSAILVNTLQDISAGGVLNGPTPPPALWPAAPVLPADAKTSDIISQM